MQAQDAVNIADLRLLAKRRLPRVMFDLLDGASEDERAAAFNVAHLREYSLVPRVLRAVAQRDQSTTLFGKTYSTFFGISPTGFISLLRRNVELMLATAAQQANIPMILSGVSSESIETVAALAPGQVWSQLYAAKDPTINADLVRRAQDSGVSILVWTVDMGAVPKNERLMRNGLGVPPRLSLLSKLEALTHPAWLLEYLRGGMTKLESWQPYVMSPPARRHSKPKSCGCRSGSNR